MQEKWSLTKELKIRMSYVTFSVGIIKKYKNLRGIS